MAGHSSRLERSGSRDARRDAPGLAPSGTAGHAVLRLQRQIGNRAVRQLLRDGPKGSPDPKAKSDLAALQEAARIVAGLGGGKQSVLAGELGKLLKADGATAAQVLEAARTVQQMVGMKWDAQVAAVRSTSDRALEIVDSLAYFLRKGKAKRLFPWIELELGRRSGLYDWHIESVFGLDDATMSSFLSQLSGDQIEALETAAARAVGHGFSQQQFERLHVNVLASESADAALKELRYLTADEFGRVEDVGETLAKDQAAALRKRIRRVRDSISVHDVGGIIAEQLKYWGDAVCAGVLSVTLEKEDKQTSVDFWTALAGNVFWAAAGFIPEVKGVWLAVKVIGSYGGAVVGSGTAAEVRKQLATTPDDPTTEFRLGITDALTEKYKKLADDRRVLHMAVDRLWELNKVDRNSDSQRTERVNLVWKMIFGDLQRDESFIRHDTAATVGAIWKAFREIYKDKPYWMTPKMALYRAIVESGVSRRLGVTSANDPKTKAVIFTFPGGARLRLEGTAEDGDYYRYEIPGEQKRPRPIRPRIAI